MFEPVTAPDLQKQRDDLLETLEVIKHTLGSKPALGYFETDVLYAKVVAAIKRNKV